MNRHFVDRFFGTEVRPVTVFEWANLITLDDQFRWEIAVVYFEVTALGNGPNLFVSILRHHVEHFHFTKHHVRVGLIKPRQFGSTAEYVVSVDDSVSTKPVIVFV